MAWFAGQVVAAAPMQGVVWVFTTEGRIYRMTPHPFLVEEFEYPAPASGALPAGDRPMPPDVVTPAVEVNPDVRRNPAFPPKTTELGDT